MTRRIVIDGHERIIDIRPMDESFIVYRKMYVPPLTPANIGTIAPHDDVEQLDLFRKKGWLTTLEEFFRTEIRALGSCAILAWDGDGVIGKMHFTTKEMYDAFRQTGGWYCVDHESMPNTIRSLSDDDVQKALASPSRTLFIVCFNVGHFDTRYHGKGIASAMLECLKSWARDRGWRRLEISSCPDVVPFRALGPQIPRREWLEKRGFFIASQTCIAPKEAAARREAIEGIVAGPPVEDAWDYTHYPWHIARIREIARDPSRIAEHDKDYVMACDLGALRAAPQP